MAGTSDLVATVRPPAAEFEIASDCHGHCDVLQVEKYVRDAMADNDASHDFNHIDRVRKTAVRLAREEVSALTRCIAGIANLKNEFCRAWRTLTSWKLAHCCTTCTTGSTAALRPQAATRRRSCFQPRCAVSTTLSVCGGDGRAPAGCQSRPHRCCQGDYQGRVVQG